MSQKDEGLEPEVSLEDAESFTGSPDAIDRALRRIFASLAQRDVIMSELAEKFWKADGWRRLRYATAAQYARERLGGPDFAQRQATTGS